MSGTGVLIVFYLNFFLLCGVALRHWFKFIAQVLQHALPCLDVSLADMDDLMVVLRLPAYRNCLLRSRGRGLSRARACAIIVVQHESMCSPLPLSMIAWL